MADFTIGQNDTLEPIVLHLFQASGAYETVDELDTVTLKMFLSTKPSVTQTHTLMLTDQATAEYEYDWQSADTTTPGLWLAKIVRVRNSDGAVKSYPNDDRFFQILIGRASP